MRGVRGTSISLSGKPSAGWGAGGTASISLLGKTADRTSDDDPRVRELRSLILDRFLLPLMRKDMTGVYNNFYLLGHVKSTIQLLKGSNQDVDYYADLVAFIEDSFSVYKTFSSLNRNNRDKLGFGTLMVRTATVTLKPQFHLYNVIIGRPEKGTPYRKEILDYIEQLLGRINLPFDRIDALVKERFVVAAAPTASPP